MPAIHLTTQAFDKAIKALPVAVVDLWAPWCGPCRSMTPIVDKIAGEYEGKALIAKVNTDDEPDISSQFGIRSIPCFLFFKNGEMVDKHVGTIRESELKAKIDSLMR